MIRISVELIAAIRAHAERDYPHECCGALLGRAGVALRGDMPGLLGVPGIALALILKLTIREPPRGYSEGGAHTVKEAPPMMLVVRTLVAKSSFRHLALASGLHAFVSYGVSAFYNSYLIRSHGFTVGEAGVWLAFIVGIGGLLGTYVGGTYADKLTQRHGDSRYMLKVPALSNLIALPFAAAAFMMSYTPLVLACLFLYVCFGTMYLAPSISATYRLVTPRERALATALLFLVLNFIGIGIGPILTGFISHTIGNNLADKPARMACATPFRSSCSRSSGRRSTTTAPCARCVRTRRRCERIGRVTRASALYRSDSVATARGSRRTPAAGSCRAARSPTRGSLRPRPCCRA